ncbi:MAG: hypothetical protein U0Q16_16570 [Bryobacteraceae bacterium]
MSTWTIDDMPESQRPKRNIFRKDSAPRAQQAPTTSSAQPHTSEVHPPAPASTAPEPNLNDYIHKSTFNRFRLFIMDALAGFPAARAAVLEAVSRALEEPPPYPEGALG